jgi:hypothetical protein
MASLITGPGLGRKDETGTGRSGLAGRHAENTLRPEAAELGQLDMREQALGRARHPLRHTESRRPDQVLDPWFEPRRYAAVRLTLEELIRTDPEDSRCGSSLGSSAAGVQVIY